MNKCSNKNSKSILFAILICVLTIFGMHSILNISVMGITLTLYRVCIPLLFIVFAYLLIFRKEEFDIVLDSYQKKVVNLTAIVFSVWIIYSIIQILLFNRIDFILSAKSLLALVLAAMTVFVMCSASFFQVKTYDYIKILKIIYILILCFAVIEVLFGVHLGTSKLSNIDRSLYTDETIEVLKHMSTSIFFNPNDYAAFIAIILPVFFVSETKSNYYCNIVVIIISIAILRINDAWISLFSVIIAYMIYCLLYKEKKSMILSKLGILVGIGSSYMFGAKILKNISNIIPSEFVSSILGGKDVNIGGKVELPTDVGKIDNVLEYQFSGGNSSFATRLDTYITSLKNMFTETFGIGYGPGNFSRYLDFTDQRETLLLNPHGLWIELLAEFGVVIFALYVGFLVFLYISLIRIYLKGQSKIVLSAIIIDTAYVFATFAPSSFLAYTYQWLVIGISLIIIIHKDEYINKDKLEKNI